jgi:hypothetical protein
MNKPLSFQVGNVPQVSHNNKKGKEDVFLRFSRKIKEVSW